MASPDETTIAPYDSQIYEPGAGRANRGWAKRTFGSIPSIGANANTNADLSAAIANLISANANVGVDGSVSKRQDLGGLLGE